MNGTAQQSGPGRVPLPAFRYYVSLSGSANLPAGSAPTGESPAAGFMECSGLELAIDVEDHAEGGQNGHVHKLPVRARPTDIVLKRGLVLQSELWKWIHKVSEGHYERRDGEISLCDQKGKIVWVWRFRRGLPIRWTGPTLSASESAIAVESMTIAHESLEMVSR